MDELFADALRQLLLDQCPPQLVRAIEAGGSAEPFWKQLEASGFADAMLGEEQGGAGLALPDAFALLELCGAHAVPVPLAQTMLARALLARAGLAPVPGSIRPATPVRPSPLLSRLRRLKPRGAGGSGLTRLCGALIVMRRFAQA